MSQGKGPKGPAATKALMTAIERADLAQVQAAVESGADARCDDDEPLCSAAMTGDLAVVQYLIDVCGADPCAQEGRVLAVAAANGHLPVVRYLLEDQGVPSTVDDLDVLCVAAEHGQLPIVKYLVEQRGADPHMFDDYPVCWAAKCGHLPVVRYFIETLKTDPLVQGNWLLREAADAGYLDIVRYLVESCSMDPRARDDEAIVAAAQGEPEVVQYLAGRIFRSEAWRGRDRGAIEADLAKIAGKIKASPGLSPDDADRAIRIIAARARKLG